MSHKEAPSSFEKNIIRSVFSIKRERREVFDYSKKLSEYIVKEQVKNLILIDRSARTFYVGIKEYIKKIYPDFKIPNIYFINPEGFKSSFHRRDEDIKIDFKEKYKKINACNKELLLILDTCIHSGKTISPVLDILNDLNFKDLRIGVISSSRDKSNLKSFSISENNPKKGCYPFGSNPSNKESIIDTSYSDDICSRRTKNARERTRAIEVRKEIKKIINEFLSN